MTGYMTEAKIASCRSSLTVCARIDPKREITEYYAEESSYPDSTVFNPQWDAVNLGFAYNDLTFVIYEYYERLGVEYVERPKIVNGFLTLKMRPLGESEISHLGFYFHPLPSPDTETRGGEEPTLPQRPILRVFEPAPPGNSHRMPDERARVAERWTVVDGTVTVVADVSEAFSELGAYRMLVWSSGDDPVPLTPEKGSL